jgi:uncharacterized membrane protein
VPDRPELISEPADREIFASTREARPLLRDPWLALTGALVVGTNALVLSGCRLAFVGAALGWWLIVVLPVHLLSTTRTRTEVSWAERVVFSVGAVLLALIVGGLVLDLVLPLFGVARPLDRMPVLFAVDLFNVVLMVRRYRRGVHARSWLLQLRSLASREWRVLTFATCCVPLVVAGANRLNNGQSDLVTLVGLSGVAVTFALVLWWRADIRDSVISAVMYLLGLSLLLSTSLRGWFVTGHDIQREYRVFELTKAHGVWNIDSFRDAYNACLSITILPTEIWQLVRVDDPYVYKVFFQLMFAVCPVVVYLLARRYWSKRIAIISVIYFVGFPTFFTDMPFLNRQETAFLFLGLGYLAITRRQWTIRHRTIVLTLCGLGVGLSHYSTMYVFVGTLAVAWISERLALLNRLWHRRPKPKHGTAPGWADATRSVGLVAIIVLGAAAFVWGGLVTRTTTGLTATVEEALPQFFGTSGGAHSNDSSYSLLPTSRTTPQQLLNEYRTETIHDRKVDDPGTYLPLSAVEHLPAHATNTSSMPLTTTGQFLSDLHVPVPALNDLVRGLAAKGEQVFVVVGLVVIGLVRWRRRQVGRAFYFLSIGSVVMVAAVTVLPGLSVSYGLLRAFQQALFLIAPVLVIGSITLFKPLGRVWAKRAAGCVALVFLVSTIGVMPQVLGGYDAQLNLNNSGVYYDEYYQHPQEVVAINWLGHQPDTLPVGVQAESTTDKYAFTSPGEVNGTELIFDIFPTLLRRQTWVVLGYTTVRTGIATTQFDGDLISYRYPLGPLRDYDDLVYDNGGTRIYK